MNRRGFLAGVAALLGLGPRVASAGGRAPGFSNFGEVAEGALHPLPCSVKGCALPAVRAVAEREHALLCRVHGGLACELLPASDSSWAGPDTEGISCRCLTTGRWSDEPPLVEVEEPR